MEKNTSREIKARCDKCGIVGHFKKNCIRYTLIQKQKDKEAEIIKSVTVKYDISSVKNLYEFLDAYFDTLNGLGKELIFEVQDLFYETSYMRENFLVKFDGSRVTSYSSHCYQGIDVMGSKYNVVKPFILTLEHTKNFHSDQDKLENIIDACKLLRVKRIYYYTPPSLHWRNDILAVVGNLVKWSSENIRETKRDSTTTVEYYSEIDGVEVDFKAQGLQTIDWLRNRGDEKLLLNEIVELYAKKMGFEYEDVVQKLTKTKRICEIEYM